MTNKDYKCAVFILTNGRPEKVITYDTLRKQGYTGDIYIILDDEDPTHEQYIQEFGAEFVITFSKKKIAESGIFDIGDNQDNHRGVVYARNATFQIAKGLGLDYFIVLDDDYMNFRYKADGNGDCIMSQKIVKDLDRMFDNLVEYYKNTNIDTLAIGQGGDYIGGGASLIAKKTKRKAMNLFVCSPDRPFKFLGRINEDTTAYVYGGSIGKLFLTVMAVALEQKQTQASSGGLTELYLDAGTYVKSFYSVLFSPSSVIVSILRSNHPRLRHRVSWPNTTPMILSEDLKKK